MFGYTIVIGEKTRSVLKGAAIAAGGAALTALTQYVGSVDFGEYTPVAVVVWSTVVNAIRKALAPAE